MAKSEREKQTISAGDVATVSASDLLDSPEGATVDALLKMGVVKGGPRKAPKHAPPSTETQIPEGYDLREIIMQFKDDPYIAGEISEGFKVVRKIKMQPGDKIRHMDYLGADGSQDFTNEATGEVVQVPWHSFLVYQDPKSGGQLVMDILGCHQLDNELPRYVGKQPRVVLVGQVKTRQGRNANDFLISVPVAK